MSKDEKKERLENMAERFMGIAEPEAKSMVVMVMFAYVEGMAAGKAEERRKWEKKQAAVTA